MGQDYDMGTTDETYNGLHAQNSGAWVDFNIDGSISAGIDQVINVEPRRFDNYNLYTRRSRNGVPTAPNMDQVEEIGQRNGLGLPVDFTDPITKQRTPNENDVPTFEQVQG